MLLYCKLLVLYHALPLCKLPSSYIKEDLTRCRSQADYGSSICIHTVYLHSTSNRMFSNCRYAPEHLIVNTKDAKDWVKDITNAGSVFLGPWAPVTVGDYASGTNHTLPTYGAARMYSGISLDSFQKHMTVQILSKEGLQNIGPSVSKMAEVEGLEAHRKSITIRLE